MVSPDKIIAKIHPGYKEAIWENELQYETTIENLEPIYFWIIDFTQAIGFKNLQKLSDNFTASPGSSYFADLGARATRMQEESMKILGYVNTVTKSVVNLIYDLKDFEMRLKNYDEYKSKDPKKKESGMLALKQMWMATVDARRGMGSLDNMAHQYGFTLLRPAFMAADSVDKLEKDGGLDINDMVRRILKPRLQEFFDWAEISEKELRQRYSIERSYLKNQIETLKLYTSWVKPYLRASEQLRMKEQNTPSLVSVFGSMVLDLELFGVGGAYDVESAVISKELPQAFKKLAKKMRTYHPILLINFSFRTHPTQQALHSGRVTIKFKAYTLNEDEILLFNKLKEEDDLSDIFAATNVTWDTLNALKDDIERFTKEEKKKREEEEGGSSFAGIFSSFKETFGFKKTPEKKKDDTSEKIKFLKEQGVPPDSYEELIIRQLTGVGAAESCLKIYDTFKKSKGMATFPNPIEEVDVIKRIRGKIARIESMKEVK